MRALAIACALALCGCETARVLSNDGKSQIAYCTEATWLECIHKACPNGYDIVSGDGCEDNIIKCKP